MKEPNLKVDYLILYRINLLVELPELTKKNLLKDNEKINCSIWNLRYPLYLGNYQNALLPILIGSDIKLYVAANKHGNIFFWKSNLYF